MNFSFKRNSIDELEIFPAQKYKYSKVSKRKQNTAAESNATRLMVTREARAG